MSIKLEIWREYACFTRPECKVERMSYPVLTPSAMRGILEAIYWKPEISWHIDSIRILEPIRWINIKRNEVSERASIRSNIRIVAFRQPIVEIDKLGGHDNLPGGDVDYAVTHHGVENLCFGALNAMSATWSALIILFTHRISLAVMNQTIRQKKFDGEECRQQQFSNT
jgi:CRISPR-associated Cas5-like protein